MLSFRPWNFFCPALLAGLATVLSSGLICSPALAQQGSGFDTSSIVGLVIAGDTEEPIEGARVAVSGQTIDVVFETMTDALGNFGFDGLPPGGWFVDVRAEGFHPAQAEAHVPEGGVEDVLFRLRRLDPPSGEVSGNVSELGTGAAIHGAIVFIPRGDGGLLPPLAFDRTDEYGNYMLLDVPAGEREVFVFHPAFISRSKLVEVHEGQITVCNFDLEQRPPAEPGTIAGRVTNADTGAPIEEAAITIIGYETFAPILTDANGEYRAGGVLPGLQLVIARRVGFYPGVQFAEVPSGGIVRADFELKARISPDAGVIEGRVTDVVTGDPIVGAKIFLRRITPNLSDTSEALNLAATPDGPAAETNAEGYYRIDQVRPGPYVVVAAAEDYFREHQRIDVMPGHASIADFELEPIPPQLAGRIAGRVVSAATGDPIGGAFVFFAPVDAVSLLDAQETGSLDIPHVETDADGLYETPRIRPGIWRLLVRARGFEPAHGRVEVVSGETARANFELNALDPADPGAIGGQVRDAATHAPIGGAVVSYARVAPLHEADGTAPDHVAPDDPDHLPHVRTDDGGYYGIRDLRPGIYFLLARADGFLPGVQFVAVRSGEITRADFELRPEVHPGPGAIEGFIADAMTHTPIPGAFVFFSRLDHADDPTAPNASELAEALTDGMTAFSPDGGGHLVRTNDRGRYHIAPLRPGVYVIIAWAPGHLPCHHIAVVRSGEGTTVNCALESETPREPGAIEGRVIDRETGGAVGGAWIFYGPARDDGSPPDWLGAPDASIPHVRSDPEGFFHIHPLRAGRYHLLAVARGFHPAHEMVGVEWGQTTQVRLALEPRDQVEPGLIGGVVQNALSGEPIAGAFVFYGPLFSSDIQAGWFESGETANVPFVRTNDQGRYLIENLHPGGFHLLARAEGFDPEHTRVEVEPGLLTEANFALAPYNPLDPGAIAGRVLEVGSGEPIAGARVFYQRLHDAPADPAAAVSTTLDPANQFVETNANGEYRIDGLRPGRYHLLAAADGFFPEGRLAFVESSQVTEANFELLARLSGTGEIFGRVINAVTLDPIAGAYVYVVPDGSLVIAGAAPAVILGETQTDAAGNYRIGGIPIGPARVVAGHPDFHRAMRQIDVVGTMALEVNFELEPRPSDPPGQVRGVVLDAETQEPIDDALVVLIHEDAAGVGSSSPGPRFSALTDSNGQYAIGEVPAGPYVAVAIKSGFERAEQHVTVESGQTTEANFSLVPGEPPMFGSLAGRVVSMETGEPIADAWLRLGSDDHEWLTQHDALARRTDADGRYEFGRLPAADYEIRVAKRGFETVHEPAIIEANQTTFVNFALEPVAHVGSIAGAVVDAVTGNPIAEALVFVPLVGLPNSANSDNAPSARTDAEGHYRIEDAPVGQRRVVAFVRGYIPEGRLVNVMLGETTIVDFELVPRPGDESMIQVQAVEAVTGSPLAGVKVHVPVTDSIEPFSSWDPFWGVTDGAGGAMLYEVPAGEFMIVGSREGYRPVLRELVPDPVAPAREAQAGVGGGVEIVTLVFELATGGNAAEDWSVYR